jgi:hypothetical protein
MEYYPYHQLMIPSTEEELENDRVNGATLVQAAKED